MEEKKHKKKRIKEVSDYKDANKVDHDKAAVDSEEGEVISSVNGNMKRQRKREGSGNDMGNAAEGRKKIKHTDNIVEAEQEVAERKLQEQVLVKKDNDNKEKDGKRKKKKEVVDGENGGRGDQAEKTRKKKKRKHKEDLANSQEIGEREEELGNDSKIEKERNREKKRKKKKKEKADHTPTIEEGEDKHGGRSDQIKERKKKKHKDKQKVGEKENAENVKENKKSTKKKLTLPSRQGKRVTFADDVQVFPVSDDEEGEGEGKGKGSARNRGIVHSKRFSPEEDQLVKEAVFKFIESRDLGDEGLDMVLHCKEHPEVRNCWKDIGSYIPWRPYTSVYYRAHTIFKRSENTTWSPEECEMIRNFHEKHGPDWKTLAEALGRHRVHVKDTWRRIKMENAKKGPWSEDEYKSLFESVNMDLRMRSLEEEKQFDSRHGMLRDNIPWEAISQKLSTRNNALCCRKWYYQLTSSMVSMGMWDDTDDYRLIDALVSVDGCSMEDVDWDNLIEHRSGDVCRKRWLQMVNQIGDQGIKSFPELVDIMSKRYCPELIDAREAWDEKLREAKKLAKTDDH